MNGNQSTAGLGVVMLTGATAAAADWSGWNPFVWGIVGFLAWTTLFGLMLMVVEADDGGGRGMSDASAIDPKDEARRGEDGSVPEGRFVSTPATPPPPPDDPAAPLEAFLTAAREYLPDCVRITSGDITLGDLRRAVAAIRELRADNLRLNAQLHEEYGRAAAASRIGPTDLGGLKRLCGDLYREGRYDQFNDVEDAFKELRELRAELAAERARFDEAERCYYAVCKHYRWDERGREVFRWGTHLEAYEDCSPTLRGAIDKRLAAKGDASS